MRASLVLSLLVLSLPSFAQSGPYSFEAADDGDPFALEPSVDEAIDAATRRFRVRVQDMNRYRARAAASGVLPQVDVRVRSNESVLDVDRFDNLNFPGDDPALIDDARNEVLEFQVNAGWDLSQIMFNPTVLDINAMVDLYDEIAEEVINVFFLRQRLVLAMINTPPDDENSRRTMELRIAQATATLNALTGGIFPDREF